MFFLPAIRQGMMVFLSRKKEAASRNLQLYSLRPCNKRYLPI